jgi:hypothetical protein
MGKTILVTLEKLVCATSMNARYAEFPIVAKRLVSNEVDLQVDCEPR